MAYQPGRLAEKLFVLSAASDEVFHESSQEAERKTRQKRRKAGDDVSRHADFVVYHRILARRRVDVYHRLRSAALVLYRFRQADGAAVCKVESLFHIEKEKKGFILFQRVRTFFLVMIGLVFFRSATVPDALRVLGRGVSGVGLQLFRNGVLSGLGLDWTELMILAVSILFSAWVTIHNKKEDMRVTLEKKPIWLRWILLGKYGPGYSASEFIYQNFKV